LLLLREKKPCQLVACTATFHRRRLRCDKLHNAKKSARIFPTYCLTPRFRACYKSSTGNLVQAWLSSRHASSIQSAHCFLSALFPTLKKGIYVNKSELIEAIAKSADISKASAEKALDGA
jgi:hypothetical protein